MEVVYMCRPEFENWGLRERPFTENGVGEGGLSERPLTEKRGDFGTKNNKETYISKWGSFGAAQVGKLEQTNVYF